YARLLDAPELSAGDRNDFVLQLVTARLDEGELAEAEKAMARYVGPPTPPYRLRAGLVAATARRWDAARTEAAAIKAEELPAGDRSWLYYLQGLIADAGNDDGRAIAAYDQAIAAAAADAARARFVLAKFRTLLLRGPLSDADLVKLRKNVEEHQGSSAGHTFARQYAAALSQRGRKAEAIEFLQRRLQVLPGEEREVRDDFRLLLGLIAGAETDAGRNALNSLLADAASRDKQRIALQLLAAGAPRAALQRTLDQLIAAEKSHPILDDLLLARAQLALNEKRYEVAEADAIALKERFPGSPLKPAALGVMMSSAWELARYRTAARYAVEARDGLPEGEPTRGQLGVLIAEAYFRAGDYRSAADAYAAALADIPKGVAPGDLMFQQIDAEIRAGRLTEATQRLDELSGDARFDLVNRWRAEWNLARALQASGEGGMKIAYARVERLLAEDASAASPLPADLRVRVAYLQARLARETGDLERALQLAPAVRRSLAGLDADLSAEVASSLALLEAETNFDLARPEAALEVLKRLREEYPKTDAAVYSYIIEADANAKQNQLVAAQRLLVDLADKFPQNRYAPYALYQAALNAEKRGQDEYYREAYRLLQQLLDRYPQNELIFAARLKQGDLLRKLNDFGPAEDVYLFLRNNFSQHGDVFAAELALADCYAAQGNVDASKLESAIGIYERLQDLPAAPVDMRAEAGFKHGYALTRRRGAETQRRAESVWWPVANALLLDETQRVKLGPQGRYWMSRLLLALGDVFEKQGKLDQAREAYELLLQQGLTGGSLARARLARFSGTDVKS
ncbi:MAG TPA: tetratricopeptide repeat protein, partial [Opitutaceae bacterium]